MRAVTALRFDADAAPHPKARRLRAPGFPRPQNTGWLPELIYKAIVFTRFIVTVQ
jgi:hypothetical protein